MEKWISVYVSKDKLRTELLKNELITNGINAVILSKVDSSYPMLGTAQINVPEGQAEAAKKLIDEFDIDEKEA